jgi:hypothetical protein
MGFTLKMSFNQFLCIHFIEYSAYVGDFSSEIVTTQRMIHRKDRME